MLTAAAVHVSGPVGGEVVGAISVLLAADRVVERENLLKEKYLYY